jgi:hypothetical protein
MPLFNEAGDYVLRDGSVIPAKIAQHLGFGDAGDLAEPFATAEGPFGAQVPASSVGAPEPAPLPPALQEEAMPQMAPQLDMPAPPAQLLTAPPMQPQQELPALGPAEGLGFNERVNRTADQYSSLGGIKNARAEGVERGTDYGVESARLNHGATTSDAKAEGTYHADAAAMHNQGAAFANKAASDFDARQNDVLKRGAQIREELDNYDLDPNRVFRRQGNWGNIADAIGVAFGALAQFSTGQNVALQLIRKKVEDDMAVQESRRGQLERQHNRLPEELQAARSVYDNDVAKDALERAFKFKVIESKLMEQIAAAKGTRAEAGLQAALFEVNNWRLEQLDKAEKSQMAWVALQAQAMGKAAKGGIPRTESILLPRFGQFVGADGRPYTAEEIGKFVGELGESGKRDFVSRRQSAEMSVRVFKDLESLQADPSLTGAEKATAEQRIANLWLQVLASVKGNASESEGKRVYEAIGGNPADILSMIKGSPDDALRRIRAYVDDTRFLVEQSLPGRVSWAGMETGAPSNPFAAPEKAPPIEEARAQLVTDIKSGNPKLVQAAVAKVGNVKGRPTAEQTSVLHQELAAVDEAYQRELAGIAEVMGTQAPSQEAIRDFAKQQPTIAQQVRDHLKSAAALQKASEKLRKQLGKSTPQGTYWKPEPAQPPEKRTVNRAVDFFKGAPKSGPSHKQ